MVGISHRMRCQRLLREAEGYLELDLPRLAINALSRMEDPGSFRGHQLWLWGEALRALGEFVEAATMLEEAAELTPSKLEIFISLGWCYKRTNRLPDAIGALERAREANPDQAIVYYNLACYQSLAGNKDAALEYLSQALIMQPGYRDHVAEESDFDPIRNDPDFQTLTAIIV